MRNEERIDTDERTDRDEIVDRDGRMGDERMGDERVGDATDGAVQPGFEQSTDAGFERRNDTDFEQPNDAGFEQRNDADFEQRNDTGFEQRNDAGFEQSTDAGFEQRSDAGFEQPDDRGFEQRSEEFRPPADDDAPTVELFAHEDVTAFRASWDKVQTRFVDDPRAAVQDADGLVADVMQSLQTTFADRKQEWAGDGQDGTAETENLRQALRRYRSFLDRLLNA